MPRGGSRVGAGRKPKGERALRQRVVAMPGVSMPPAWAVPPADAPDVTGERRALLQPPDDLAEPAASFWRMWAPWAIERNTLTDAEAAGFRELCERYVIKRAIWERLLTLGPASAEADRLLKRHEKYSHLYETSLGRFRLTSFGKALDQTGKKKPEAVNPWAGLARKA